MMTNDITKDFIEKILNYSKENNISEKESVKKFGLNYKRLYYYKKKFNIPRNPVGRAPFTHRSTRRNNVNDNFFGTPNKLNCYYAGFFAADGCISQNNKTCTISLSTKDIEWLKKYKDNLEFEGDIHTYKVRDKFSTSTVSFISSKISSDLKNNFNITPAKSLTLKHPNIVDTELVDYFICGYIDGDGCISISKSKRIQNKMIISVIGTLDMCEWIKKRFCEIIGNERGVIRKLHGYSDSTYTYTVTDKTAREIFKHYYKLNCPKLDRKWSMERYNYCINYEKRKPISKRKGVNVFDLNGNFIQHFNTLKEAQDFTGVSFTTISKLCKENNNLHAGNGYMFSRDDKKKMDAYQPNKYINKKSWLGKDNSKLMDAGNVDIEMADTYGDDAQEN